MECKREPKCPNLNFNIVSELTMTRCLLQKHLIIRKKVLSNLNLIFVDPKTYLELLATSFN